MLLIATIASLVATTLVCEVPFLANAFGFTSIGLAEYGISIGLSLLIIPLIEIVKLIKRAIAKKKEVVIEDEVVEIEEDDEEENEVVEISSKQTENDNENKE